jgi:hypothetical protein
VSQGQSDSGRAYRVRLHHACRWSLGHPLSASRRP